MDGSDRQNEKTRERLAPRHKPQQDRSRARFQALLDAAEQVIIESGLQGLAMREVARRADLSIASVYHYFPSTAALIRALVDQQLEELRNILETGLTSRFPDDSANFTDEQIHSLIDEIAEFFFNTPSVPEVWAGLYAYPDLRALNIEDTKKNATLLQPYLERFFPALGAEQANMNAVVLVEWVSATMRFATASAPDVRVKLIDALKVLIAHTLTGLSQANSAASNEN